MYTFRYHGLSIQVIAVRIVLIAKSTQLDDISKYV